MTALKVPQKKKQPDIGQKDDNKLKELLLQTQKKNCTNTEELN
jgi:hypothetical protein